MRLTFKNLSLIFAAGSVGGLIKGLAAWACGAVGFNALLGSQMAPVLTPFWVYQHMVWGGLWAFLFLLPLKGLSYISLGVIYSLPQTLISLVVIMPGMHRGLLGLGLGHMTPVLILIFGFIWGIATALWLKWSRES
ncbi:MAG: hypothetical protein PHU44_04200 [Syntrophales bacterium]|nr:hypothetical protein [Syntrophales bacterium]MDD5642894.1 hypothetical protein [Syntrophales bacterium]